MAEISIKIPDEFKEEILSISKKLDFESLVNKAINKVLQEEIEEEILFNLAERIASKSQLSDEEVFKFSEEVKDRVVKLHE